MANIVGLGPTQDQLNATSQMPLRPGAQLQDGQDIVKPESLKPEAAPVDIYYHPQQAPINHDYENLIQGLSTLNSALDGYKSATANKKDPKEKALTDEQRDTLTARYAGRSSDEISQVLRDGSDPELQQKAAATFVGNVRAMKQGDADAAFLQDYYNTKFDRTNGNWDQEVQQFVAKRLATDYVNNPAGARSYMERMSGFNRGMQSSVAQDKANNNSYMVQQTAQDGFTSIWKNAVDAGKPPSMLVKETADFFNTSKDVMRLPYKDQAKLAVQNGNQMLTEMEAHPEKADRILEAAKAIYQGERVDPRDGVSRKIIDQPEGVGDMAQQLMTNLQKKRDEINKGQQSDNLASWKANATLRPEEFDPNKFKAWRDQNPGAVSDSTSQEILVSHEKALEKARKSAIDYEAQQKATQATGDVSAQDYANFQKGKAFDLGNTTVPQKNYYLKGDQSAVSQLSGDARREKIIELYQKDMETQRATLINQGKKPEEVDNYLNGKMIEDFRQNGMYPKQWKSEASASVNMLTSAAQSGKEMPQESLKAFEKFKLLQAQAPELIPQIYGERERQIFESASIVPGTPTEQLRGAIQYYAKKDDAAEAVAKKDVQDAIGKVNRGWGDWFGSWGSGEYPDNPQVLNDIVTKRATYLVRAYHMSPEDAVKQAVEISKSHVTSINGKLINTDDHRLTPTFQQDAKKHLSWLAETVGPQAFGADSASDMTLETMPNGSFQVISKKHGYNPEGKEIIVQGPDGHPHDARFITPEMMQLMAQRTRDEQESTAVDHGSNRLKPLFVIPGTSVGLGRPHWTPLSKEEQAVERKNFDEAGKVKGNNQQWLKQFKTNAQHANEQNDEAFSVVRKATPRNPFKPNQ